MCPVACSQSACQSTSISSAYRLLILKRYQFRNLKYFPLRVRVWPSAPRCTVCLLASRVSGSLGTSSSCSLWQSSCERAPARSLHLNQFKLSTKDVADITRHRFLAVSFERTVLAVCLEQRAYLWLGYLGEHQKPPVADNTLSHVNPSNLSELSKTR